MRIKPTIFLSSLKVSYGKTCFDLNVSTNEENAPATLVQQHGFPGSQRREEMKNSEG